MVVHKKSSHTVTVLDAIGASVNEALVSVLQLTL